MADVHGFPQIEMLSHGRRIRSVVVHIVAGTDLRRAAVATPVVRHHAIALLEEEQHLYVPIVTAQRPTVMKHNGLSRLWTPVLVKDLRAVGSLDEFAAHFMVSFR